jgi:hypothetical protein
MASILEQLTSSLDEGTITKIGQTIGVDPAILNKGFAVAGPLVLGMLAKKSGQPGGEEQVTKLAEEGAAAADPTDLIGGILGKMMSGSGGGQGGGTQADLLGGLMGPGVNAISGTLNKSLGFDVKPILTMALPIILGIVMKMLKGGQVAPNQLASTLQTETKSFMDDPNNLETSRLIQAAEQAGTQAEALRGQFSDDDWKKIRMAPAGALYVVATASPSKGKGEVEELGAAITTVGDAIKNVEPTSLIGTAFGGGLTSDEINILKGDAPPTETILATITEAVGLVDAKSPNDAAAYRQMIVDLATNVAGATKEGGFLGFGGQQVTEEEQAAIQAVASAAGQPVTA